MAEADVPIIYDILCSAVFLILEIMDAMVVILVDDAVEVVWGGIVHNNYLIVGVGLCQHTVDGLFKIFIFIGWYSYAIFNIISHVSLSFGQRYEIILYLPNSESFFFSFHAKEIVGEKGTEANKIACDEAYCYYAK